MTIIPRCLRQHIQCANGHFTRIEPTPTEWTLPAWRRVRTLAEERLLIHNTSLRRLNATVQPLVDYKSSPAPSARRPPATGVSEVLSSPSAGHSPATEVDEVFSSPSPPHSDPLRRNPFFEYRCSDPTSTPLQFTPSLVRDKVQTSTPVIAKTLPQLASPPRRPSVLHGPATATQPASDTAPSTAPMFSTVDDSDVEVIELSLVRVVLLSLDGLRVAKFIERKDNGLMRRLFLCKKFKLPPAQGLYYRFGPNDDRNGCRSGIGA
jgi:hypothetical protein